VLDYREALDEACVRDVRASAEINEVAYFVDARQSLIRDLRLDEVSLEAIVREKVKRLSFCHKEPLEPMLAFDDSLDCLLQLGVILVVHNLARSPRKEVIEETVSG